MSHHVQHQTLIDLLERTRRIGTWSVEVATGVCDWSETTYAIHEEDPSKAIRVEDGILYYVPEHRPTIERCVQEAIERSEPWDVELKLQTAKGRVRWVRAIGEALVEDGEVVRLHGIFEDIHERKTLELEREALLQRMLEAERLARSGHWKQTIDPRSIEWSPGMHTLFGWPAEHAPSEPVVMSDVHPDDRVRVAEALNGARERRERNTVEFRVVLEGFEMRYQMVTFPVLGAPGTTAVAGVVTDVTDAVESKVQIERLNRRLTLALEASRIGVWEWQPSSGALIWDPQMYALYGTSEDQFSGAYEAWENGLHPDDRERAAQEVQQAATDGHFDTQFRVVWPRTGEVRHIRAKANLHRGVDGELETMVGANWDVTDIVKTKAELERSNRDLADLAHRTSHDLKAPLTTIKRLAEYVREDIESGGLEEAKGNVEEIARQAAALENLVLGCLRAATVDAADATIEVVDMVSIVEEEVASGLAALADVQGVDVERRVAVSRPCLIPRSPVVQVLSNLVTNAIRYRDPNREASFVRVEVSRSGDNLLLVVEDNGSGIPTQNLDEIFEMFRTYHPKGRSGDGLGLYIVKRYVEALGGTVRVESGPGGTRFEVVFFAKEAA